nr:sodium-dependent acetylcholine transporter-like isoform X2 [Drosophila takahashii]
MGFDSSYGSGRKPFSPDLNRGKWEKPTDYILACFGLGLKMDVFDLTFWEVNDMGILGILPYLVYMVIYLVPIIIIHSFMGQFSSSGFISALRLSPFFKGMGYVSVFLSVSMLIYYSIYAAIPLLFIINSFRPTLPWSCEGSKSWHNETAWPSICNDNITKYKLIRIPSVLYFQDLFQQNETSSIENYYELSWHLVGLFALVWGMIAFIFHKFSETTMFGKFIRYMVIGTLALLLVCFVRILFLPGALKGLRKYMTPKPKDWVLGTGSTFLIALQAFGAGWGSVIALSSFNGFRTNIFSYSWIISFGQIFIYIMFCMVSFMLEHYFSELPESSDKTVVHTIWVLIVSSASALSTMGWPNMWTFIYYTMLLMAAVITITTQIFTILQSLFDEFEELRVRKKKVTFGLIGGLAVCSIFFCTNHVVLWIYGRESFQRDIEFMLGQPFASWKIYILRFIAPIILVICLLIGISWSILDPDYFTVEFLAMSIIVVWLPLLAIPGYGIYNLSQSTGTVWDRLRRTCRPTDWYPLEVEFRQKYEKAVGTTETHQLLEVTEEVN